MDRPEKALTLHCATQAEVLPFVMRAEKFATHYDAALAGKISNGARCYIVKEAGVPIAGYVLNRIGDDLWIEAAEGRAGVDLCALLAGLVEIQGANLNYIMFKTTRRGLVKKAERLGYEMAATIMRKKIK